MPIVNNTFRGQIDPNITVAEWHLVREAVARQLERETNLMTLLQNTARLGCDGSPQQARRRDRQMEVIDSYKQLLNKMGRPVGRVSLNLLPGPGVVDCKELRDSLRETSSWLGAAFIGVGIVMSILVVLPLAMWFSIAGAVIFLAGWLLSWPIATLWRLLVSSRLPRPGSRPVFRVAAAGKLSKNYSVLSNYLP